MRRGFSLIKATVLLDQCHSQIWDTTIFIQPRIDADETRMHGNTGFQLIISSTSFQLVIVARRHGFVNSPRIFEDGIRILMSKIVCLFTQLRFGIKCSSGSVNATKKAARNCGQAKAAVKPDSRRTTKKLRVNPLSFVFHCELGRMRNIFSFRKDARNAKKSMPLIRLIKSDSICLDKSFFQSRVAYHEDTKKRRRHKKPSCA